MRDFCGRVLRRKKEIILSKRRDLDSYQIGRWSYGDVRVLRYRVSGNLKIGSFCSFGEDTLIMLGGDHNPRNISTFPFGVLMGGVSDTAHATTKGDVVIGSDVWVGLHSTILSGVKIGDGAVIGANSLVTRDVPPYAIAAGNPARVVKMRFPQPVIDELLRIQWWSWSDDDIKRAAPLLLDENVDRFLEFAAGQSRKKA